MGLYTEYEGTNQQWQITPWAQIDYTLSSKQASSPESWVSRSTYVFTDVIGHGFTDFFQVGTISSTDPLKPYIVDGAIQLCTRITYLDGMTFS